MPLIERLENGVTLQSFQYKGDLLLAIQSNPNLRLVGRLVTPYRLTKGKVYVLCEYPSETEAREAARTAREYAQSWFLSNPPLTQAAIDRSKETELGLAVENALEGTVNAQRFPGILCLEDLRQGLSEEHIDCTDQSLHRELRLLGWRKYARAMVKGKREQVWVHGDIADPLSTLNQIPPAELI